MNSLEGRRVFLSGGAKGIGGAIARHLAREGAHVLIADIDIDSAQSLAWAIGAESVELDVTDLHEVRRVIDARQPFDILVNNAGVDQHAFFTQTTIEDWRRLIAINLESVFATTHAVLPAMQEAKFGRIINIASEAGRLGSKGGAVYAAAKGAVIAFSRSIARENARLGITVNVIAPGPVETPMLLKAVARGGDKLLEAMKAATLVGRLGTPEEVAAAVAFFASQEAGFITGEVLGVSGGMGCGQ